MHEFLKYFLLLQLHLLVFKLVWHGGRNTYIIKTNYSLEPCLKALHYTHESWELLGYLVWKGEAETATMAGCQLDASIPLPGTPVLAIACWRDLGEVLSVPLFPHLFKLISLAFP